MKRTSESGVRKFSLGVGARSHTFFIVVAPFKSACATFLAEIRLQRFGKSCSLDFFKNEVLDFCFFVGDVIFGGFCVYLDDVVGPWEPIQRADFGDQSFVENKAIIQVLSAFD